MHQDVDVFAARLSPGAEVKHTLAAGRHAWLQVARGAVTVNDTELRAGDGAAASEERELTIVGLEPAEFLLFDLA